MRRTRRDQGGALLGAIMLTGILAVLGTVSLQLAVEESRTIRLTQEDAASQFLARSGAEMVIRWFHAPESAPAGPGGSLFEKRLTLADGQASFFDAMGRSQFTGTHDQPGILFDASRPDDDRLLNDHTSGWFRSVRALGRILSLRVYGPSRLGALCTVEVTAESGRSVATVSLELGARIIPPLRVGTQIGQRGQSVMPETPVPAWVHWGDLTVKGAALLGKQGELPVKSDLAPISGQSYAEMGNRGDRWLKILIGADVRFSDNATGLPSNVFPKQDPVPGLKEDIWDYELMKQQAMLYGTYYTMDQNGLLYRDGMAEGSQGITPDDAFRSTVVGDHRGLVFVDTLDRRPPSGENVGTLTISADYLEGLFVVNAHVRFTPKGEGRTVQALSPPKDGSSSFATRTPTSLSRINLQGVMYVAGSVAYEGSPRIYGALSVGGSLVRGPDASLPIEVWYNSELRSGLVRGMPVVAPLKGSWLAKL